MPALADVLQAGQVEEGGGHGGRLQDGSEAILQRRSGLGIEASAERHATASGLPLR